MSCQNIKEEIEWEKKFLVGKIITYLNKEGKECKWEIVSRINNTKACTIIAWAKPSDRLVMIKQYRPSVGKYVIELPAGLIDEKETINKAAIRELKEETGYTGEIDNYTQELLISAGLTDEKTSIVEITIDELNNKNRNIEQELEEDEDIEVFLVPRQEIANFLEDMINEDDVEVSAIMISYLLGAKVI